MSEEKPKIFLSYAHEDIGMAKRIYQDLKRYSLDIWFDNESLLGGQNWKFEINKAIKESSYFLAVLSKESIDSIGYVQKELKIALEMLDLYPKNKTYMLPVRIEDCEPIEERLSDLHWIDVFPETDYQNGLKKILQVVSPGTLLLRSEPLELLDADISVLIKNFGFYDKHKNPDSKGFNHQYIIKEIKGDKVVIDETSGLMWQQSGYSGFYTIYKNAKKYIDKIKNDRFAGYNDWRLPTIEEAMSLMEPERKHGGDLYIDPIFDNKQVWIWTADLYKGRSSSAWVVGFGLGGCISSYFGFTNDVRAVRSAQSSVD